MGVMQQTKVNCAKKFEKKNSAFLECCDIITNLKKEKKYLQFNIKKINVQKNSILGLLPGYVLIIYLDFTRLELFKNIKHIKFCLIFS